jgi:hypothetical protein
MSTAEYRRKKHLAYYAAHREEIIARRRARYAAKKAAMPPKVKPARIPKQPKAKTPEELAAYRERKRRNTAAWKARNRGYVPPRKSRAKVAVSTPAPKPVADDKSRRAQLLRERFMAWKETTQS